MQFFTQSLRGLIGLMFFIPIVGLTQNPKMPPGTGQADSSVQRTNETLDWLSAGMMEVGQAGQLQASARIVRLFIGEPRKWQLPLSLYSGVSQPGSSAAMFGGGSNESITSQLFSAWSGMMNVGFEGQRLWSDWGAQSGLRLVYQFGERILSGYRISSPSDPLRGKQQLLWNHYVVAGCVVYTGAWERDNPRNLGRGWLMFRGHFNYSSPNDLRWLFPLDRLRGLYGGGSLGVGIEISRVVHLRAVICWPWLRPEWSTRHSITQFSFQYNWKP